MGTRILVTYATWAGSTRQVAEAVGEAVRGENTVVDVLRARDVAGISPYDAVVVGAAVRMGRPHRDARAFVKRHRQALRTVPVAYFLVCMTMRDDTEDTRREVEGYLDALRRKAPAVEPVATGLFAGAVLTEGAACAISMRETPARALESMYFVSGFWPKRRTMTRCSSRPGTSPRLFQTRKCATSTRIGPFSPSRRIADLKAHFMVLGERHLEYLLESYAGYYNSKRPHRGLGNVPIAVGKPPPPEEISTKDGVACDLWLGGLLRHYRRAA